jgi:RNA polymerase-binding transcription factor
VADYACAVDDDRARQLLDRERNRIQESLAAINREGPLEASDRLEPGDHDSEDLYQDEFNAGRREQLEQELAAVERAEDRLKAGKYGLSVESGEPIPDERLEVLPTAERTVEEEERYRRR